MDRILVTGFDPFGGDSTNPSWLVAQALHGREIAGHRVVAGLLPTVFGRSLDVLEGLLAQHDPAVTICLGQAGGRAALSLERVAININDARIADNAAAQPVDTPVHAGGPAAWFSTLPLKAMLLAMQREGVRTEVSQTAGTFVCNHVFYGLMHLLAQRNAQVPRHGARPVRGGFIHVPWLPGQGEPSMPLEEMVRGLRAALHTAVTTRQDAVIGAGTLH